MVNIFVHVYSLCLHFFLLLHPFFFLFFFPLLFFSSLPLAVAFRRSAIKGPIVAVYCDIKNYDYEKKKQVCDYR